jgi:hypothetical protein
MDKYIVVDLKGKENHINNKKHQFFSTLILNLKEKSNLEIFNDWSDKVFQSLESFLSNSNVVDLIVIDNGKVVGFKHAIITNITRDIDGSVHTKITYNGFLDEKHPYIKSYNRNKAISQFL